MVILRLLWLVYFSYTSNNWVYDLASSGQFVQSVQYFLSMCLVVSFGFFNRSFLYVTPMPMLVLVLNFPGVIDTVDAVNHF